jgi:hypothetical protein
MKALLSGRDEQCQNAEKPAKFNSDCAWFSADVTLRLKEKMNSGAGGRTRTDTTFYGPRILSPVRLPFRHTGARQGSQKFLTGARRGKRRRNLKQNPPKSRSRSFASEPAEDQ